MNIRYAGPIRALGGIALVGIVIAVIFPALRDALIPAESQRAVLIQAVPFVAAFIAVLLLYILVIVLSARRLNGRISNRAHAPITWVLIVGIAAGVVFLFQPFFMIGYRFGFTLLLISTLGFILWSHIEPRSSRHDAALPPIKPTQHLVGAVVAAVVALLLFFTLLSANMPQEPYGLRQRVWDRYDEARKVEIASEMVNTFNVVEVPFLVMLSLFPAALAYFAVRELMPSPVPATPAFMPPAKRAT